MRVLWFSNTPASGEEYLKSPVVRGGWLKSLDRILKDKVDLHVAFYYPKFVEPFEYNGVNYYPICKKNWKLEIFKKLLLGDFIDEEDLGVYMSVIEKVKPDIIHIHGSENPFGCLIGHTHIPIVLSIQGNETVYLHKYFSGIEQNYLTGRQFNTLSLKSFLFQRSYKKEYAVYRKTQQREIKNISKCKNFIGRTDWDRRVSRVLAHKSTYFHNDEVLRDSFYNTVWNKTSGGELVIQSTIGANFFKGLETVCEALYELNQLNLQLEWRIAGISNNDTIVQIVKNKLGSRFPEKGLYLLGNLSEADLMAKLLQSDIYVMPSHIENSPNNLCEAMILGMPCIATFAGGTGSLLKDKEEGILIQDGDPWSMAGAVLELSNNQEVARAYGANAREIALVRHKKEKIVSELIAIYLLIIKKPINP